MVIRYSARDPAFKKVHLKKQDTEIFEKVSVYKKVSSLNQFHLLTQCDTSITQTKLAVLIQEKSHHIKNWFRLISEKVIS